MIFVIGAFFWILALAAAARLLYVSRAIIQPHAWLWGLLALAACALLFRPHEDIFGGEDPGSYLNSGVTYGRQGNLFYVDPLLAQTPPESRKAFYYGHAGYGTTKDACLWVVNMEVGMLGPHFQPAYPLLISVLTRLGNSSWSLYVVPLFALFTGLALMVLASRLLAHRLAGLIAFGCYLLNPLTLWHARCARPEIIAGFMAFAGLALLLLAWQTRPWRKWPDILLGAFCIGAAPFFHITAWYLAIPIAIAVGLVILRGRADFLLYVPPALAMLAVFYGETRYVTDYYHVQRFLDATFQYWPHLALGLILLTGISLAANRRRSCIAADVNERPVVSTWLAAGLAFASTLFIAQAYFSRFFIGSLPILGCPLPNYIYLTDWQTFANMVSYPMALLALAGWVAWLTCDRALRPERLTLALAVLPAIALAGTMRDFMMTRYLLLAVVPMSALCLTALITRLPELPRHPWTAWLAPGLALVIGLAGLTGRWHLVGMSEHRGFLRFLAPFAQTIRQEHGILLGEYSRLTAPLEHMYGIQALGLDNERQDDYNTAERAWETIMRAHPDQPAFFITPFQAPRSARFDFILVKQDVFRDRKLQQAHNNLPTRIQEMPLALSLYRMTLKDAARPAAVLTNVTALPLDGGNMGLRRFANGRVEKPVLEGIALAAGELVNLTIPGDLQTQLIELVFVIYSSDPNPLPPLVNGTGSSSGMRNRGNFQRLEDQWWAYTYRPNMSAGSSMLAITARSPIFIAAGLIRTKQSAVPIASGYSKSARREVLPPLKGRWARADAAVLMPATTPGYLFLLVLTPPSATSGTLSLSITPDQAGAWHSTMPLQPDAWQWLILPLPGAINRDAWMDIEIQPAWNPRKAGFPSDLGVFFGKLIVAPAPEDG